MSKIRRIAQTALLCLGLAAPAAANDLPQVKLSYIVQHPAIDATRDGIIKALGKAGFIDGETMELEVQNAQGSMPTQVQINRKFAGDDPDLIIAISTPSAQTAMSATSDIPIVFAAVTDPVGAGLVDSLDHPGRNLTGSSDKTPVNLHLALIRRLVPEAQSVGVIYNTGEANSASQVQELYAEANKAGLTIVEATAPQTSAVLDAARSLVGKVEAIYVPADSTVVSAIDAVVRVAIEARLPVITADTGSVERGALAAYGFNYEDLGLTAGSLAVSILQGAEPADLPVAFVDTLQLYVNAAAADSIGIILSPEVLADAAVVVQ